MEVGFALLSSVTFEFISYYFFQLFGITLKTFGLLASVPTELSPLAPFSSGDIFESTKSYLDGQQLTSILIDGQQSFFYDLCFGVSLATSAGV